MRPNRPLLPLLALLALGTTFGACAKSEPAPSAAPSPAAKATDEAKPARESKRAGKRQANGESTRALGLRVRLELLSKLGVDGLRVEVSADGGKVVLAGEVKQRATAELAEEVSRQVEGVASVENRIRLAGAESGDQVDRALAETENELADAALETRVRLALVDRLGSDGFRIGTEAASGVVTLEFPKKMKSARRKDAVEVAKALEGVTKVVQLDKE